MSFSLAASEYSQVVKTAVDTCANSVPILAGVGGSTRQAIEYAQEAERLGAKACCCCRTTSPKPARTGLPPTLKRCASR